MADVQDVQTPEAQPEAKQEVKFTDYPFSESILADIAAAGFVRPTPIQAAAIPAALEGKHLIGLAQTGTGKTAAFALPIIQKLAQSIELAALVLVPTRELAMQVTGVFNQLGKSSGIRVATIVGGIPMENDYKALRSWPNVLVATPGRLIDHLTYNSVSLKEIQVLVVDEADRMHDMGFIPQIRRIIDDLPEKRQTMMFTATMPSDVERIARMSMNDPVRIQVGLQVPVEGAKQQLFRVSDDEKAPLLLKLLADSENDGRVLVFVRTKRGCDKLHRIVCRRFHAARLHGDREQADRDEAMNGFREGRYRILIATDIAARGIDVSNIEHVINYDFPLSAEDYVHRIGRTARQQATGLATSFVTPADRRFLLDAYKLLGDKLPLTDDLKDMVGGRRKRRGRDRQAQRRDGAESPVVTGEIRNHQENETSDAPPARRRRRRGRGRGRNGEPRPHDSHSGNRPAPAMAEAVAEAPAPAQTHAPAKAHAPARKPATEAHAPAEHRRTPIEKQREEEGNVVILGREHDWDEGHVVILDREFSDDRPETSEERGDRRRRRGRSRRGRRGSPSAASATPNQDAAQ